jgi:two-component system, NtrC family, sensor kinase
VPVPSDRLRVLLDSAELGVWHLHVPSGQVTRNEAYLRSTQAPADTLGHGVEVWLERIHPADRELVLSKRQELLSGELDSYSVEYRMQRPGGGWIALRGYVAITERDPEGKPQWVSGLLMDISREREFERRLHAIFDRPFQFVGLLTPEGVLLETNRTSVRESGHKPEDVIGKLFWEGPFFDYSPALQQQLKESVAKAARGELIRFEMRTPARQGIQGTVDFTLTPVRDDDGQIINIIPEGRDISDLVRTREALRSAEQRLSAASQAAEIGLWEWNVETGEMWFSEQWYRMLGLNSTGAVIDVKNWRNLVHQDDRPRVQAEVARQVKAEHPDNRIELRMARGDGSWGWFLSIARAVVRDEQGGARRIAGVLMDISDRKEAERRLAAAERLQSIGQLAAGMAHEINTPVQFASDSVYFIREATQELLDHIKQLQAALPGAPALNPALQELDAELPAALDRIAEGLSRIAEISNSLKEFSHGDYEAMTPIDLNRSIQNTLIVARSEFKYIADLETQFTDLPLVTCYGSQINQVILSLLVNAAQAIARFKRGSSERGLITVRTLQDGNCAVISIGDTGGGIPESIRGRVFEPFVTTKAVGEGSGQGLSMAHKVIVSGHGGSINFKSEAGSGTTFVIRLPIDGRAHPGQVSAA